MISRDEAWHTSTLPSCRDINAAASPSTSSKRLFKDLAGKTSRLCSVLLLVLQVYELTIAENTRKASGTLLKIAQA